MFPQIQETLWVAVCTACEALIACVNQLNIMDGECGNGDYGTVIARGAKAVQDTIQDNKVERNFPHVAFKQLGNVIQDTVDDHKAGIYSVFFDAIAESLKEHHCNQQVTETTLLNAFIAGNRAISKNKKAHECERSLLDALLPAEQKLVDELKQGSSPIVAFAAAVKAAEESAMRTVHTYRYPDPGAHAVGIWMRAAYEATKLRITKV